MGFFWQGELWLGRGWGCGFTDVNPLSRPPAHWQSLEDVVVVCGACLAAGLAVWSVLRCVSCCRCRRGFFLHNSRGEVFDAVTIKRNKRGKGKGEGSQRRCVLAFSFSSTRTTRSRFCLEGNRLK